MQDPCHQKHCCDFTDSDDPDDELLRDKGCCGPIPVKRDCLAPVLPVPECDEEDPVITYDPETEEFFALSIMYDNQCSPWWTTSVNDPWMALIR